MIKIATPISHLFENLSDAQYITNNSDCLECRDRSFNVNLPNQEVFHCNIQPIHKLSKDAFYYLEKILKIKPDLKLITFHAASSCTKPYISEKMFQKGGVQYSRDDMLKNARENIPQIKAIYGSQVNVAIENNNYYPTEAYRWITDADFIKQVVYENDISFVFDFAHANITSHNGKLNYEDYKCGLPLDKLIQVHICGYAIGKDNIAYDEHSIPGQEEWEELRSMLSSACDLIYLTVEYYKDTGKLIESLKEVRKIINELP